ncbi:MAG: lipid II:glycine glycyltransferase FemX [Anaerolineales bacterium]
MRYKIDSATEWDSTLLSLPTPHILQTWTWGAFKERYGWRALHFLWKEEKTDPRIAAQVLTQERGRFSVGYVPKGPLVDWTKPLLVESALEGLEQVARQESLLMLKIDPDVRADTVEGQRIQKILKRRGWRPSFEQIQFRNTMFLDLRPSLDEILAEMKSKWRYNIRLAKRRGVEVRQAGRDELPEVYAIYQETAERDEFIIREEKYYLDAWLEFMDAGLGDSFVAEVEGEMVAMLILLHFGERAWYMYGASRDVHRSLMPNHLLQWEAIRRAKALGCTTYDLWGAPDILQESDPMWGVYRFKLGFGAEFVPHIGAYDYPPHPLLYRLYAFLRPRFVALAERRYWLGQR